MPRNSLLAVAVLIGACGPPGGASSDEVGNPPPATTATDPGEAPSPMPPHSPPPAAGDRDPPATAPTEPAAPVEREDSVEDTGLPEPEPDETGPPPEACRLAESGPVRAERNGQVFEHLHIVAEGEPAVASSTPLLRRLSGHAPLEQPARWIHGDRVARSHLRTAHPHSPARLLRLRAPRPSQKPDRQSRSSPVTASLPGRPPATEKVRMPAASSTSIISSFPS